MMLKHGKNASAVKLKIEKKALCIWSWCFMLHWGVGFLLLLHTFFFLCDPRGGRWGLSVVIGSISDPLALGGKMLQPFHQLYWFSPGRGMGFWTCNQLSHSCCGGHCKLWFTQLTVVGYMLGSWIVWSSLLKLVKDEFLSFYNCESLGN